MKEYTKPYFEEELIEIEDIMVLSGETDTIDDSNGDDIGGGN